MKAISKEAQRTLERMVERLDPNGLNIDTGGKSLMSVSLTRIDERTVAVGHYYIQNGDAMADPDITFWRGPDERWYVTEWRQDGVPGIFGHQRIVEFENEIPKRFHAKRQRDVSAFVTTWMRNIKDQQRRWFAENKAA